MLFLDLNSDVITHVLSTCCQPERLSLSLTSRNLHATALPILLRSITLDQGSAQVLSFSNYIISGAHRAGMCVRHLVIGWRYWHLKREGRGGSSYLHPTEEEETILHHRTTRLMEAIESMPLLYSLNIKAHAGIIAYYSEKPFLQTILQRPHLGQLGLDSSHLRGLKSLQLAMREQFNSAIVVLNDSASPLRALDLNIHCDVINLEPVCGNGLARLLSYHSIHLRKLALCHFNLEPYLRGPSYNKYMQSYTSQHPTNLGPVIFPLVRSLRLDECQVTWGSLARSFPSVEVTTLDSLYDSAGNFSLARLPISDADVDNLPVLFPLLTSIAARITFLNDLSLTKSFHSIHRIKIKQLWWVNTVEDAENEFMSLRHSSNLKVLHIEGLERRPLSWWNRFVQVIPNLTFLKIAIYDYNTGPWSDMMVCDLSDSTRHLLIKLW